MKATIRTVVVCNQHGLHARPCHSLVTTAMAFKSKLRVRYSGRDVNGKSILELMTLNAACGAELELVAEGVDAGDLLERVSELFTSGFGELTT